MENNTNMRGKFWIPLALLATCAFLACAYFSYRYFFCDKIVGKVIVVQRDAYANRMALIKVVAIRKADALAWRDRVVRNVYSLNEEIRQEQQDAKGRIEANRKYYDEKIRAIGVTKDAYLRAKDLAKHVWLVDAADDASKTKFFALIAMKGLPRASEVEALAISSRWQEALELMKNELIPDLERQAQALTKESEEQERSIFLESGVKVREFRENLRRMVSPETLAYVPDHVPVADSDITDESGQYSLRLPRGDYYVFAHGSRKVYAATENYSWAVPVSVPSRQSEKCLLGNMNLVGQGSGDLWEGLPTFSKEDL